MLLRHAHALGLPLSFPQRDLGRLPVTVEKRNHSDLWGGGDKMLALNCCWSPGTPSATEPPVKVWADSPQLRSSSQRPRWSRELPAVLNRLDNRQKAHTDCNHGRGPRRGKG